MSVIDQLLQLDDGPVLSQVRSAFQQNLRASPALAPSWFHGTLGIYCPEVENTSPHFLIDEAAIAIAVLAVSTISDYGFAGAVNASWATNRLAQLLTPSNTDFVAITHDLYAFYFPTSSTSPAGNYAEILASAHGSSNAQEKVRYCDRAASAADAGIGGQLADTLVSDAFVTTQMAAYTANPTGFVQRMHMYLHMVNLLAPARAGDVTAKWDPLIHINEVPWTTYDGLTSDNFSSQTWIGQAGALAFTSRVTGRHPGQTFCHGGMAAQCYTEPGPDAHVYGESLAAWIGRAGGQFPAYFTGASLSNTD